MFIQFLSPYIQLSFLASWGLAQNLEGLGIFKYFNTPPMQIGNTTFYPLVLDAKIGVASLAMLLTGYLIILFFLNVRASFYLNKWVGLICLFIWFLPGLLSIFGYIPNFLAMGPDMFLLNEGFPGSMDSAAANLVICLVSGWSLILLISSLWKKNTFKNIYDHIWYTLGLLSALFFVVDTGRSTYERSLADTDERMVLTLQLFRSAEEHLESLCTLPKVLELSPSLCSIAPELKWGVQNYLDMKSNLRARIEPPSWVAKLANNPIFAHQIRALNNWACTEGKQPTQCKPVPIGAALSIDDINTPIAFPTPNYAEVIQHFYISMAKSDQRIKDIERGHNFRYFVFLALAFLAGGKLANASRAMVKDDSIFPRSWFFCLIIFLYKKIAYQLIVLVIALTKTYYSTVKNAIKNSQKNKLIQKFNYKWGNKKTHKEPERA